MKRFPLSRTARWCAISFLCGVAATEWISVSIVWISVIVWAGIIALGSGRKTILWVFGFCIIGFAGGLLRGEGSTPQMPVRDIGVFHDQGIREWEGVIVREPDVRETKQKLTVRVEHYNDGQEIYSGLMLLEADTYPWFTYGDSVRIRCEIQEPFVSNEFSYKDYLARQHIFSWCRNPASIERFDSGEGLWILERLFYFKRWLIGGMNTMIPEPHSTLLSGVLFGARSAFPKDVADDFSSVGITHIVAISGYNITLVMVAIVGVLKGAGIGRKRIVWAVLVGITVFTVFAGAASSAVRAALMGGLVLIAQYKGRAHMVGHTLIVAAALMVLFSPSILLHDAGFQLSFLATLGLVYGSPIIGRATSRIPLWTWLKELLDQTLSAIIFTAPLIIVQFSSFSVVALLANILILPAMPLTMVLGVAVVLMYAISVVLGPLSSAWHLVADPIAWCTWLVLEYVLMMAHVLARIPYAVLHISFNEWSWVFLVLTYAFLFWTVTMLKQK